MTNLFTDILDHPTIFGSQLKTLRNSYEFTLDFVASESGLSKAFICQVESGKRSINILDFKKLLSVYNYTVLRFFSESADAVEGKKFSPDAPVQSEEHSILIDGSRQEDKYSLILKRPISDENDLAILELFLPGELEYPKDYVSHDSIVRGVVLEGELLIHFKDDELLIKRGGDFLFNANRSHIFRNHKKEDLRALLIVQNPFF